MDKLKKIEKLKSLGFTDEEINELFSLPEEQAVAKASEIMFLKTGINLVGNDQEQVLAHFIKIKTERDRYLRDLQVAMRIVIDLGKNFGVVGDDDKLKKMEPSEYGAVVIEKVGGLISDYGYTQSDNEIVKARYEEKLKSQWRFLAAVLPMAGRYEPASREVLEQFITEGLGK